MSIGSGSGWEYLQLAISREPSPGQWPISSWLHRGQGRDPEEVKGTDPATLLNELGRDGWELVGPPEVLSVISTHVDSGDTSREREHWVERRFWLKRRRAY
jgi:hypothetical protein